MHNSTRESQNWKRPSWFRLFHYHLRIYYTSIKSQNLSYYFSIELFKFIFLYARNTFKNLNIFRATHIALYGFVCIFLLIGRLDAVAVKPAPKPISEEAYRKKTDVLTQVLKYGTSLERKAALAEVEKIPSEYQNELKPLIIESFKKEKDPGMRLAFLRVAGTLKLIESKDDVLMSLEDENEDIARSAVATLKKWEDPDSWNDLLRRLKKEDLSKNSNLSVSIINALGEIPGGEGASTYLEAKLKEKFNSSEIRAQIALYFGKKKLTHAEVTLQQLAFSEAETLTLRTYAISSLGKINSVSSMPKLRELITEIRNNPNSDSKRNQLLKIYSLGALIELGDAEVFDEIVEFTKDDDSIVRLRSIQFLLDSKRPEAREILEYKSKRDPSPKVQKAATDALKKLDGETTEGSDSASDETKPESANQDSIDDKAQSTGKTGK
ncbi:HEAT repeat domain-containing protein [Leptospira sp. GIMC2001]|uniref:HEAT repeat domain-containing protein n=1 Tax=Leptospira sp. GIMC2001 TaxID=1513297 RepID=UPI00234B3998|nr:HEAT repeat domain-containing protein [Leptospira sp. GIMC2001]WCL50271.1 HEAT repeat domain-containing protein [Leptospira sp. GIMC2001]